MPESILNLPDRIASLRGEDRARVERLELPDLPQVRLSASIGIAQARARHATVRDWMDDADAALYRAKSEGRNQVAEDPGVAAAAARA